MIRKRNYGFRSSGFFSSIHFLNKLTLFLVHSRWPVLQAHLTICFLFMLSEKLSFFFISKPNSSNLALTKFFKYFYWRKQRKKLINNSLGECDGGGGFLSFTFKALLLSLDRNILNMKSKLLKAAFQGRKCFSRDR